MASKPQIKKPVRGKKRWTKLPEMIETVFEKKSFSKITRLNVVFNLKNVLRNPYEIGSSLDNYWNLMPTTTDTQLRKIAKSNLTVAKIVDGNKLSSNDKSIFI